MWAVSPKPLLTNSLSLEKYPSRISKLRVDYSHKQQPCVQAFYFYQVVLCITNFSCKEEKEKASSAFKYQYPQLVPKATSPVKEALPEHLLTKTTTKTSTDKLLLGHY